MTRDDEPYERALEGALPPDARHDDDGHPSPDLLAGLAEGSLREEGRGAVEAHLLACAECRAAVATVATTAKAPARGRTWRLLVAAAAVLVVGVGGWLLARGGGNAPDAVVREDADAALLASARELGATRPDLFGEFRPIDHAERVAARPDALRGGLALRTPRETILGGRPTFRWTAVPRVKEYTLALRGADGDAVWTRAVAAPEGADVVEAAFPAEAADLPPGSAWQWSVSGKRAAGTVDGSLGFRVASAAEGDRLAEAEREITRIGPPELADLLLAQYAARLGFLEEAMAAAKRQVARHPVAAARETVDYLRARLGDAAAAK
jgi:hypothetical protein